MKVPILDYADAAATRPRPPAAATPPDAMDLHRTLAATRQQLAAALRRIDALLEQESLLRRRVAAAEQTAAQARQFAYQDPLTGLPDRRVLLDRFDQAAARAARQHRQVALLFLDLDGFKRINDAHGHAAGDAVLQQVAARLVACLRISDTACRYGGDEFVILLPDFEGQESAAAVVEKIRARVESPYFVGHTELRLTTSIGMAVYPVDGQQYGELIQVSDFAMYRNKGRGRAPSSGIEAAPENGRPPDGIDSAVEYRHATDHTGANPSGGELRSGTGRSVQ
jgi:diguanylate cyclase (GGDEF)-like protein